MSLAGMDRVKDMTAAEILADIRRTQRERAMVIAVAILALAVLVAGLLLGGAL